jgi:hypothetical protein
MAFVDDIGSASAGDQYREYHKYLQFFHDVRIDGHDLEKAPFAVRQRFTESG